MKDATAAADATRRATKSAEANALEAPASRSAPTTRRNATRGDDRRGGGERRRRFVAERAEVDALDDLARAKATAGVVADARGTRGGRGDLDLGEGTTPRRARRGAASSRRACARRRRRVGTTEGSFVSRVVHRRYYVDVCFSSRSSVHGGGAANVLSPHVSVSAEAPRANRERRLAPPSPPPPRLFLFRLSPRPRGGILAWARTACRRGAGVPWRRVARAPGAFDPSRAPRKPPTRHPARHPRPDMSCARCPRHARAPPPTSRRSRRRRDDTRARRVRTVSNFVNASLRRVPSPRPR